VYVTVNRLEGQVIEVFARLGKSGGCGAATMEAVGRLLSLGLRCGLDPAHLIKQLGGIQCHRSPSCLEAVAAVLKVEVEF
jgi:ribonucleoside-diphosphate reductase alpha chain